jgi:hypothetical protein
MALYQYPLYTSTGKKGRTGDCADAALACTEGFVVRELAREEEVDVEVLEHGPAGACAQCDLADPAGR